MHTVFTNKGTFSAENTFIGTEKKLGEFPVGFGIVTPLTAKRTALEKHGSANSGTVIYAEFLYVEYQSFSHNQNSISAITG